MIAFAFVCLWLTFWLVDMGVLMNAITLTSEEFDAIVAEQDRQRRIKARQQALRNAWHMNKGPQLSLAEKLAALQRVEEGTK